MLSVAAVAATPRELADEYCSHTNAAWCVDSDGDGIRDSAPQLHPRFTEEGIEHLREKGRYFDPNDVVEYEPGPTATPTPTPTPTPTSTPAPTQVTVGNLGESTNGAIIIGNLLSDYQHATGFSTGARSGGYTLVSVAAAFNTTSGSPGDIVVAVHASSNGVPAATALYTLTGSNPASASTYTYTCSGSCSLAASTGYFLVLSAPNASTSTFYNWAFTFSDNEAKAPTNNGWSLANNAKFKVGQGSWQDTSDNQSGKFKITAR